MRLLLAFGLALGLALVAAPVALAQIPFVGASATLELAIDALDEPLDEGVPAETTLYLRYCYVAHGGLAREPTQVALDVAEAPEWALVELDPPLVEIPIAMPSGPSPTVCAPEQTAIVRVTLAPGAPFDGNASVKIFADARENGLLAPSAADITFLVASPSAPPAPAATEDAEPDGRSVPAPGLALVLAGAAAVALALARRPKA